MCAHAYTVCDCLVETDLSLTLQCLHDMKWETYLYEVNGINFKLSDQGYGPSNQKSHQAEHAWKYLHLFFLPQTLTWMN